jgi:hypothetical protein
MKKATIITAILAAGTLTTAQAADYEYLTIEKADGTQLSLTAVGLTISYSATAMTATNGSETATIALSELNRMYFSNTKDATGISELSSLAQDDEATVYDLSGRQIAEGRLSTVKALLKKGVYLVKQHGKTVKIQVR